MENNKIDPQSRDYDASKIVPDKRFTQTTKEMAITFIVYGFYMLFMIGNVMLSGDVANYTFVGGFPSWLFRQVCILIGMVIAVELVTHFVYKDMDITPHGKIKGDKDED